MVVAVRSRSARLPRRLASLLTELERRSQLRLLLLMARVTDSFLWPGLRNLSRKEDQMRRTATTVWPLPETECYLRISGAQAYEVGVIRWNNIMAYVSSGVPSFLALTITRKDKTLENILATVTAIERKLDQSNIYRDNPPGLRETSASTSYSLSQVSIFTKNSSI